MCVATRICGLAILCVGLWTTPGGSTVAANPSPSPGLPPETPLVAISGPYRWPVVAARLGGADGAEIRLILDTGSPCTLLDSSLRGRLGRSRDAEKVVSFRGSQQGELHPRPTISIQGVSLLGGSNVVTVELSRLIPPLRPHVDGILGMDCLRHYCVQLDFHAKQLRFLDPGRLDTNQLGRAFPLEFETEHSHGGIPLLRYPGLLGGNGTNTVIDTGDGGDGTARGDAIRHHAPGSYSGNFLRRCKHFLAVEGLVDRGVQLPGCVWAGNTYTNIVMDHGSGRWSDWIGVRFLARHVVTLDFPDRTMYLRQFSVGPI